MRNLLICLSIVVITLFSGCGGDDDNTSTSDNNSILDDGASLSIGQTYRGEIGSDTGDDDTRNYKFTASTSGEFTILIDNLSPLADVDIKITDSQGGFISSAMGYDDTYETLTQTLEAGMLYYILVDNAEEYDTSYDIMISYSSSSAGGDTDMPSDTTGSVNDGSSTDFISVGVGQIYNGKVGSDSGEYDKSYYKFTTSSTGDYTILINNISPESDLDFYLYDSNLEILQSAYTSSTVEESLTASLETGNTYYIEVDNYDEEDVNYNLLISTSYSSGYWVLSEKIRHYDPREDTDSTFYDDQLTEGSIQFYQNEPSGNIPYTFASNSSWSAIPSQLTPDNQLSVDLQIDISDASDDVYYLGHSLNVDIQYEDIGCGGTYANRLELGSVGVATTQSGGPSSDSENILYTIPSGSTNGEIFVLRVCGTTGNSGLGYRYIYEWTE